jgi:uncharacterized membrane protein
MALKLPKLPKIKKPKLPKLKAPKLPSLKAPKLPKIKGPKLPTKAGVTAAGMAAFGRAKAFGIENIIGILFGIPIILSIVVFSKAGMFGVGPYLGSFNILAFLISLAGAYMNLTAIPGTMSMMMNILTLAIVIGISSYAVNVANNLPKEEKEEKEKEETKE